MSAPAPKPPASSTRKAELLHRRAELHRQLAAVDEELAREEEHEARRRAPTGWVDQSTSPLGKRAHLEACRAGLPHKAVGKRRLARLEDVERWMEAHDKPRRRVVEPTESGVDLAAAFGVQP